MEWLWRCQVVGGVYGPVAQAGEAIVIWGRGKVVVPADKFNGVFVGLATEVGALALHNLIRDETK